MSGDERLQADHAGDFFEIFAEIIGGTAGAPTHAFVLAMELRDDADVEHAEGEFRPATEASSETRLNALTASTLLAVSAATDRS